MAVDIYGKELKVGDVIVSSRGSLAICIIKAIKGDKNSAPLIVDYKNYDGRWIEGKVTSSRSIVKVGDEYVD